MVSDGIELDVLTGVTVSALDAGGGTLAVAVTGLDGRFTFDIPAGPAELSFAKDLYTSPALLHSGVGIGEHVQINVTMNEAATGKPSVLLSAAGDDFGYGATVALTASAGDPNDAALTYTWSNAAGSGPSATVTFPSMAEAFAARTDPANPGAFISGYTLEDRFGIVPIITDTRGQITTTVTVDDGRGQSATVSLRLNAASILANTHDVPLHQRIYMNSGHTGPSAWTFTSVPTGSTAAFDDPTSRTPSFTPDVLGAYTLTEGANTTTIYAGTWFGAIGGGSGDSITISSRCSVCHQNPTLQAQYDIPDMFTPWSQTGHATMFTRGINGDVSNYYSGDCIGCHTVGNDPGVASGGFDDVAGAAGWLMPKLDATNWDSLVQTMPQVAQLANVQCESCHGPQGGAGPGGFATAHTMTWDANSTSQPFQSPRVSYSAEACGTCHGAGDHHIYSEWATAAASGMSHSNRGGENGASASATGLSSSCGRCHSAQGYTLYADALAAGQVGLVSTDPRLALVTNKTNEPVTCVACHDPHDASHPNQLRFYGDTPNLPGGFAGHGMGKGALCLTCHNSRNGAQTGSTTLTYLHEDGEPYNAGNPTGYSAPHQAAQGDVFTGHNAYFMGSAMPMTSKHAAITDTCVGCHMTLQPEQRLAFGQPTALSHVFRITDANKAILCASCHGANVDGEGIQAQVEAQLTALGAKIGTAVKTKLNAAGAINVCAWDPTLDVYSGKSCSVTTAFFPINTATNPIVSAQIQEIHGQVGFIVTVTTPITITYYSAAGAVVATKTTNSFGVQLGSFKDNATTPAAIYALSGNLVRAGWNYFLVEGDQSKGLHNPSFVNAVLNTTLAKDLSF